VKLSLKLLKISKLYEVNHVEGVNMSNMYKLESVNYDMCSRYFWTKTKRYKTVGITMLGCGKQCKKLRQAYRYIMHQS